MNPSPVRSLRVVIVQEALRRYRTRFYECLRQRLADDGIELDLIHNTLPPGDDPRGDVADVPWAQWVPARRWTVAGREVVHQPVVGRIRDADLVVVEQASRLLLNYGLLATPSAIGPQVAMWGHGASFEESTHALGEWVKRRLSRFPSWWFAYNELSAGVVSGLGFPRDRITVVDNSSDTAALRQQLDRVTPERASALRRAMGEPRGEILVFVGALSDRKKLPFLFAVADELSRLRPQAHLAVAGYGPWRPWTERESGRRNNVSYLGALFDADLAALLSISSLLLIPAWAGLVVTDAFAAGLPPMASLDHVHPPEVGYIRHGENGFLVRDGRDPQRFANAVAAVLDDPVRLEHARRGATTESDHFNAEAMADRFAGGVVSALAPRQRGATVL